VSGAVVVLRGLSRWFGEVVALNGIDLEVGPGITGILGPNGAGKSTFMHLATGQIDPSKGSITMWGEPIRNNLGVLRRIGYLPEQDRFWKEVTGLEFVTLLAGLSGLSAGRARDAARRAIERVDMKERAGDPIGTYSRGMRQRIKLAQAIVHEPDLLLLDEPMTGLDPESRQRCIDLVRELASEGRTVIISSHVLHEVESLTSEVILLVRGRILATGDVKHIRAHIERCPHTIRCRSKEVRALARELLATPGLMGLELGEEDQLLTIRTQDPGAVHAVIADAVTAGRITVERVSAADDTLDAIFKYVVG
jgi:ABC-2 type transport system ATP-binding protein